MIRGFVANRSNTFVPLTDEGIFVDDRLVSCKMRPNQRHVFENFRDERLMVVTQPPGSGKSTLVKFVHAFDLIQNPNRKLVIAVPQTVIAKTFRRVVLKYDNGNELEWDVGYDLCGEVQQSKINEIIRFLKMQDYPNGLHERVLICSHSALALAYSLIRQEDTREIIKNTTFVLDEAHHVLSAEATNVEVQNRLGEFCDDFLRIDEPSAKLWFPTATFFRGDRLSIIKGKDSKRFKTHYLPLDQHWQENIKYITSYSFDFLIYKGDPWEEFRFALRKGKRKTIIYAPASNRSLAGGCKYAFTEEVKKIIKEEWGDNANILDLVDETGRDDRKLELEDEAASKKIDAIIAINMVNEGTDWPSAEQIIDMAPSQSLRIMVQRFGRLIRDLKGKGHLNYYMLLPFCLDQLDEETYRASLNKNFAAFTASLLIEDCIRPIQIPHPNSEQGSASIYRPNYFHLEVPDENKRRQLIDDVASGLLVLRGDADVNNRSLSNDEIREQVEITVREAGVHNNVEAVAKTIVALLRRRAIEYDVDVSWTVDMGFEKIWRNEIFDSLLNFVSGNCDISTFVEFRRIYQSKADLNWDEKYIEVKAIRGTK